MRLFSGFATVATLLLLCQEPARAQADNPALASARQHLQQQYAEAFPGLPQLYSGPEYADYTRRYHARIGHQFYGAPEPQAGSVDYNGYHYTNLRLAYDVVRDQLLLPQPSSPLLLQLVDERVNGFRLGDHRFVRLVADSASADVLTTGYYEVLVDSACQVLARRSKRMQQKIVDGSIDVKFTPADKLLVKKGGRYYAVTKKSAALRLFADRSKEMQQYAQAQRLSFKKDRLEASVVQLARYYNRLSGQ